MTITLTISLTTIKILNSTTRTLTKNYNPNGLSNGDFTRSCKSISLSFKFCHCNEKGIKFICIASHDLICFEKVLG